MSELEIAVAVVGGGRTSVDGRYVDSPNDTLLEDVLKDAGLFDGTKITSGTLPAGFLVKTPTGTKYVPVKTKPMAL